MDQYIGQLLLAISALGSAIVYLFRLLSQQWNDRLKYIEDQLQRCQSGNDEKQKQLDELTQLVTRSQATALTATEQKHG